MPATSIWPGEAPKVTSDTKVTFPEEKFNVRMRTRRTLASEVLYANSLSIPRCGFRQALLPLLCGLKDVTGTETTPSQDDYLFDFDPNLTAAALNAPKACSLELGDNVQAYQVEYCMFDKITFKGDIAQDGGEAPVSMDATYFGRRLQTHAFTPALSQAPIVPMNAKLARLYMDPTWITLGTTELAGLLRGFQIEILTGVHPDFAGAANTYFTAHKEGYIDYTATFTLEGGTTAHALLAAQQAQTKKFFRLAINGPVIGTGTPHALVFDMAGIPETVGPNDSADRGDNLSTIALHGVYDDTGAKGLQVQLTTDSLVP